MFQTTILQVALSTSVFHLLDYLPHSTTDLDRLVPGIRLWVPFGNQKKVGILVNLSTHTLLAPEKLRTILSVIDEEPLLTPALFKLKRWISDYYHHPLGEVLIDTLPKLLKEGRPIALAQQVLWKTATNISEDHFAKLNKTPQQKALLHFLAAHPQGLSVSQLLTQFSRTVFNALKNKSLIEAYSTENLVEKRKDFIPVKQTLNDEQTVAVAAITAHLDCFNTYLLQGITGSGKTEVYLHCIEAVIKNKKQALVLVPEIGLTPQTLARFRHFFSEPIGMLHSGCTDLERFETWIRAKTGQIKIIIGTRSAVFTPFLALGLILIDESHDASFKQQDGLRYSARDISIMRARMENIPVVLGSATPNLESIWNVQQGRAIPLFLRQRAGLAKLPYYTVIDIRNQPLKNGFSSALVERINAHLQNKNQVLIFLNRRGYAPTLLCHQCGFIAVCKYCDARLTLHQSPLRLHCHHCDRSLEVYTHCPTCLTSKLLHLGQGTERIEQTLQGLFPAFTIARIDKDSTQKKGSLSLILNQIASGQSQILIGTQMLAKGHHFPNVTLVVILDADSGFFSADFRAEERMAQLILQVSGRAGRETKQGEVVIQTHQPHHPQLKNLLEQGYERFARFALNERKEANLPPYSYMAILRAECLDRAYPMLFLQQVKQAMLTELSPSVQLLGPIPSPMEKRANHYRSQLLLQSNHRGSLHETLNLLVSVIKEIKIQKKLRWSLDIDPIEMF